MRGFVKNWSSVLHLKFCLLTEHIKYHTLSSSTNYSVSNPISTICSGHNASQQTKITQIPSGQAAHSGVASSCRVMGRGDNPRNAELIQPEDGTSWSWYCFYDVVDASLQSLYQTSFYQWSIEEQRWVIKYLVFRHWRLLLRETTKRM